MKTLWSIVRRARGSFRGSLPLSALFVVGAATLAGAASGALPAILGAALGAMMDRATPPAPGTLGGLFLALTSLPAYAVILLTFAATLATVGLSVLSSRLGSELSGELTAALRIELTRAALGASARDVEEAGRAMLGSRAGPAPPPGVKLPEARGAEAVKLAIARESGLVADFAVASMTGLPQALVTLLVLAFELIAGNTWFVLAGGTFLFVLSRLVADRASRAVARETQAMQRADVGVFAELGEKLGSTEDLRLLGAREQAIAELSEAARGAADARSRFARALAVSGQIKSVFSAMSPLIVVVAIQVSAASFEASDIAKLLLYMPLLMGRLEGLDAIRVGLIERRPVIAATDRLLALPPSPSAPPKPLSLRDVKGRDIRFDDVTFTPKGGNKPVLNGLTLQIPEGAMVGICGPSGCGKSTLLRLLLRLDEPDRGVVRVGGVDVRDIDPAALPELFGVLGQSSRLFERSIAKNLEVGRKGGTTDDELRAALRSAKLDDFAQEDATRGLSTEVRLVPPSLSGGEQRRVLLARMLLRNPSIFVLDEPEAGLPSATAEALLQNVKVVAEGRTCIVVTHAPHLLGSTFNVVMEEGQIAAKGSHEELAASSPIYQSLLAEGLKSKAPKASPGPPPGPMAPPRAVS